MRQCLRQSACLVPVHLRRLSPPQDSLLDALRASDFHPRDGDVIILSSKVVSIDEGRCVLKSRTTRQQLALQESHAGFDGSSHDSPFDLAIIHHALIPSAGVDASNSGDYYTLLPSDPCASARKWHRILCEQYDLKSIGVIITDSHLLPMRWGVVDIAIGFWGVNPLRDYRGESDLFGYIFQVSQANLVDSIASAAGWIMGQGTEQIPVVIARHWPNVQFNSEKDYRKKFYIAPEDDVYSSVLKVIKKKDGVFW